jgi:hypothetical protein
MNELCGEIETGFRLCFSTASLTLYISWVSNLQNGNLQGRGRDILLIVPIVCSAENSRNEMMCRCNWVNYILLFDTTEFYPEIARTLIIILYI